MYRRLLLLLKKTGGLLGAGLFYAFLCGKAGHPLIPCLFHAATGFLCPGCGVSRMCLRLLRLDLAGAFCANAAVLLLLIPGIPMAVLLALRYIRTGEFRLSRLQTASIWVAVGLLLLFGLLRNLTPFSILRP